MTSRAFRFEVPIPRFPVLAALARRRLRRSTPPEPVLVLDERGFTAWGGLRVAWTDVVSWSVFHHHAVYVDPEEEEGLREDVIDEWLVLVNVEHPEIHLRRLAPEIREAYDGPDDARFGTPIRFGIEGLDAAPAEVVAEFERYSGKRPTTSDGLEVMAQDGYKTTP